MKIRRLGGASRWSLLLVLACSDEQDDDLLVASATLELSADCARASPTATFGSVVDFRSVRTYNPPGCGKGQVVLSESFEIEALPRGGGRGGAPSTGGGNGGTGFVNVKWADTVPTTEAACTSMWIAAYRFGHDGTTFIAEDFKFGTGLWGDDQCFPPSFFLIDIPRHTRQLFAASARVAPTSAAATRKVSLTSLY